jgi:hypothetical protein
MPYEEEDTCTTECYRGAGHETQPAYVLSSILSECLYI